MPPRPVITLYGRPGCHLCDAARTTLMRLRQRLNFDVVEIDIESDEALLKRYLLEIPVVAHEGVELARAPISAVALEEALVLRLR